MVRQWQGEKRSSACSDGTVNVGIHVPLATVSGLEVISGIIQGFTIGVIKGDARSLDFAHINPI